VGATTFVNVSSCLRPVVQAQTARCRGRGRGRRGRPVRLNADMPVPVLAVLDGRVLPADEAVLPVTDEGLLRGDGVFEVLRVYAGRAFALEDHLRRLERSARNLRLDIDAELARREIAALLAAAGPHDGAVRYLVTRSGRRIGLLEALKPGADPVALVCVEYVPPRVLDGIKSLSYAGNMLATRLAREAGGDDALLVTPHGRILEGPTSTFFASLDGQTLVTPPLSDRVLDSITRRRLLGLLPHAREEVVSREELRRAGEAFIASTTREVQAVASIDGAALPAAPGTLTRAAAAAFSAHVRAELG
jgi:branched-chain amino acid aminotransferase